MKLNNQDKRSKALGCLLLPAALGAIVLALALISLFALMLVMLFENPTGAPD
jgi:hypothetical protein